MGKTMRLRGHAALVGTTFLLLASCNAIWGISDADVGSAPDASSGSGGTSGTAGAAGSQPDGGAGKDTGSGDAPVLDAQDGGADDGSLDAPAEESGSNCEGGNGDCDGDPVNGCETDTTTSPDHCGACKAACNGFCVSSACTAVEVIASDQFNVPFFGGIAFNDTDVFWVSSSDSDQSAEKYRIQKCAKSLPATPTTLSPNHPWLNMIMTGSQRVYFVGTSQARILYGMAFDGTGLSQELTNVYGVSWGSNRIYYASNYSTSAFLKYKDTLTSTEGTVYSKKTPDWTSESVGSSLIADGTYVADVEKSSAGYRIFGNSSATPAVSGTKSAGRIRKEGDDLLWVEYPPTSTDNRLVKYKGASSAEVTLSTAWGVNDVAFNYPLAFVSVKGNQAESSAPALEVIKVTDNSKRRLRAPADLKSPEIDNGYLYFFMSQRLVRISLSVL